MSRPYLSSDHLWDCVDGVAILPQKTGQIMVEIAKGNHYPANLPEGRHGSHVLDIGRGVQVRVHGFVKRDDAGDWKVDRAYLSTEQYPTGRALTGSMIDRTCEKIESLISKWAHYNADKLSEANTIWRNNDAMRLEDQIEAREAELSVLQAHLTACDNNDVYSPYPLKD